MCPSNLGHEASPRRSDGGHGKPPTVGPPVPGYPGWHGTRVLCGPCEQRPADKAGAEWIDTVLGTGVSDTGHTRHTRYVCVVCGRCLFRRLCPEKGAKPRPSRVGLLAPI